jgi:hypothetical protein
MMRRFPVLLLAALLIVGLVPVAASAQTSAQEFWRDRSAGAFRDLDCVAVEGCQDREGYPIEELSEVHLGVDTLKELYPDLDYGALDTAIADLEAAFEGGDPDAIKAAAEAVQAEGAIVVADTATAVAEPTAVDTGSPVDSGPNMALLGVAALLILLAGGAFLLRLTTDRR